MDTKDLMIGDFVRIKEDVEPDAYFLHEDMYPGQIVKVQEVLSIGINPDWMCGEINDLLVEDALDPIPLDIELLEQIGFKQFHPSARLWEYGEKVFVDLHCPIDGRITIAIGGNSYQLEYLHQLQHAMRLCGIELEIKL